MKRIILLLSAALFLMSCSKDDDTTPPEPRCFKDSTDLKTVWYGGSAICTGLYKECAKYNCVLDFADGTTETLNGESGVYLQNSDPIASKLYPVSVIISDRTSNPQFETGGRVGICQVGGNQVLLKTITGEEYIFYLGTANWTWRNNSGKIVKKITLTKKLF